jgi:IPT/TIG domain
VTTYGGTSSTSFTLAPPTPPAITSVSPASGAANTQVTISGSNFGATQGSRTVWVGTSLAAVVSWSDTQILARVACNATSATARVQQGGSWSNSPAFTVSTPTISTVTPDNGAPGLTVTITGTGFGAVPGAGGQVWLGTANGVVQSWSDTQVVATIGASATSGSARILQGCVMSNAKPFTVNRLHIDDVTPSSALPGTLITITGTGFGPTQGSGTVILGSTSGVDVNWSDTVITARVAATSLTGIVQVYPNGVPPSGASFAVRRSSSGTVAG